MANSTDPLPLAVVTGGASGLGRNTAERLMRDYRVVIADHDGDTAAKTANDLNGNRGWVRHVELDVTDPEAVARVFQKIEDDYGPVEALVNNAGVLGSTGPMEDIEPEEFRRIFAVNAEGVFLCTKAVFPGMRQRKKGAVVSIASTGGKDAPGFASAYCGSKAAVIGMTKSWSKEVAQQGIRVNCVSPTLIGDTGMEAEMGKDFRDGSVSKIPMGRPARLDEISAVVAFLLSDDASFVTGQCYDVSGGRSVF